jgi:cysteinyl-tRNA synthetase
MLRWGTFRRHLRRVSSGFLRNSHSNGYATPFTVYNSLSKQYETLMTRLPSRLTWYLCGPTVYDDSHLGHARTYICFDIIRRIMEHRGIRIMQVINITDVDDKILVRAKQLDLNPHQLSGIYLKSFMEDMSQLGIRPPFLMTRVSDYISEIISYIRGILKNGYAYVIGNDVYFDVNAFQKNHRYGKLQPSRQESPSNPNFLITHNEMDLTIKRDLRDFVLWKGRHHEEEEERETLEWDSPWGMGRPGWHVECSAMCK